MLVITLFQEFLNTFLLEIFSKEHRYIFIFHFKHVFCTGKIVNSSVGFFFHSKKTTLKNV